jgi:hypothetical protein
MASARYNSGIARQKKSREKEYRANMAKPAPYGRTEDGQPRLSPTANRARSGQTRNIAARKKVAAKRTSAKNAAGAEGPKKSMPRKKPRNSVGNVSSQMGGKNSMGRRDGGPAATADGRERVGKQSTKAVRKYQGAEGPKKSTPRKTTTRKKAR